MLTNKNGLALVCKGTSKESRMDCIVHSKWCGGFPN